MIEKNTAEHLRVLIVFAHPSYETSRINRAFCEAVKDIPGITLHDLYQTYPEQLIDVPREQALLEECDVLILQHPLYWYSCPALMKNWIDSVITLGWAYGQDSQGKSGDALKGKSFIQVISSGGSEDVYQRGGYNNFTLAELLRPFEQTADLCDMPYRQPFLTQDLRKLDAAGIHAKVEGYLQWINDLLRGKLPPVINSHHAPQADYSQQHAHQHDVQLN